MQSTILRYGIYYALILCLGFLGSYCIFGEDPENYSKSEMLGYGVMIFASIVIIFAIRASKQSNNDQLSFPRGLGVGAGVSAIGSLAFALYNWVYVTWIHPSFLTEYMDYQKTQVLNSQLPDAVVQQQLSELVTYSEMMSNPVLMASLMFATVFVIGLMFTLAATLALRSKAA